MIHIPALSYVKTTTVKIKNNNRDKKVPSLKEYLLLTELNPE